MNNKKIFPCVVNNVSEHLSDSTCTYIVCRVVCGELWYYGAYDDEDFAFAVASRLGDNAVVVNNG